MAAIDKIYGTIEQYEEFYDWCEENKPEAIEYFYIWDEEWYDGEYHPMTNFPESIDMWLVENCPIDWVVEAIKEQYDF